MVRMPLPFYMYVGDPAPPPRRHSVASTAIWPWQMSTVPPGRPSSSTGASPKRSYIKGPQTHIGEEDETASNNPPAVQEEEAVDVRPNHDEKWLSMTTTEKRRLWLHRRRSGEFYFRSEFKGLVHAVRKPRGGIRWFDTRWTAIQLRVSLVSSQV